MHYFIQVQVTFEFGTLAEGNSNIFFHIIAKSDNGNRIKSIPPCNVLHLSDHLTRIGFSLERMYLPLGEQISILNLFYEILLFPYYLFKIYKKVINLTNAKRYNHTIGVQLLVECPYVLRQLRRPRCLQNVAPKATSRITRMMRFALVIFLSYLFSTIFLRSLPPV